MNFQNFVKSKWSIGFLLLLVGITYSFTLFFPFFFDDYVAIVGNLDIRSLDFFTNKETWLSPNKRPISFLSFYWNFKYSQLDPAGYRAFNIIIHLLNTLLVFYISKLLFEFWDITKANFNILALLAAFIFSIHPIQSQPVIYIVQRMALLSATFYLLATAAYLWFRLKSKGETLQFIFLLLAIGIITLFGIWSKQNAATIPLMVLAIDFLLFPNKNRKVKIYIILFIGIVGLAALFQFSIYLSTHSSVFRNISRMQYFQTQWIVFPQYLFLIIFPYFQSVDPFIPWIESTVDYRFWLGLLFILSCISLGIYAVWKKKSMLAFSVIWVAISLAVESSFFPIKDAMAVHRLYLPMLAFSILLSYWLFQFKKSWLIYSVLIYLLLSLILRFHTWSSSELLWQDAISKSAENPRPYNNLGVWYLEQNNISEAQKMFETSIRIDSTYAKAWSNLGMLLLNQEKYEDAIHLLHKSLMYQRPNAEANNNIGLAWKKIGVNSEAIKYFEVATRFTPKLKEAYFNLGVCYTEAGEIENAILNYKVALSLDAKYSDALYNYGTLMMNIGEFEVAIGLLEMASQEESTDISVLNNLGICQFNLGNLEKSKNYFKKILELQPSNTLALENLTTLERM